MNLNWTLCLLTRCLISQKLSCLIIGTAQQIDAKLMHPAQKFRQNLLVKFYSITDFNFLFQQIKTLVWGLLQCKTLEVSGPCHGALEAIIRKYLCVQIKRLLGSDTLHAC